MNLINALVTRKQSEPAHLLQGHVVRLVAAPYSVWQRFRLCPIESNVSENFKMIQNPGFLPDHPQNWIASSFCHSRHSRKFQKDPSITFWVILLTHKQTNIQTKSGKNITSLAEEIISTTSQDWRHLSFISLMSIFWFAPDNVCIDLHSVINANLNVVMFLFILLFCTYCVQAPTLFRVNKTRI